MTMRGLFRLAVGLVTLAQAAAAGARPPFVTPAPLAAERDVLIDKIARGADYEASVARFAALLRELAALREAAVQAEQLEREHGTGRSPRPPAPR